uniref:Uncharacterized protein n=1 Tax=Arundo donax TaxID=35708 RepID=A0A0A9G113_ARUDO
MELYIYVAKLIGWLSHPWIDGPRPVRSIMESHK